MGFFSNKSLFALAIVGLSVLSAVDARECPNGEGRFFNNECYKAVTTPATYEDAQAVCVGLGGRLPAMESEWANEWFQQEFATSNDMWIGTPTGPYRNWAYGTQPTACPAMQRDGQHAGRSCGNTQRYVCAKPLVGEQALCLDSSPTPNQWNAIEGKSTVHVSGDHEIVRTIIKNVPHQATVESAIASTDEDRTACNDVLTRIVVPTGAYTNTHVIEYDIENKDKCAVGEDYSGTEVVKQSWVIGCEYENIVFGVTHSPQHKDLVALNSRVVVRTDGRGTDTTIVVNPLDDGTTCRVDFACNWVYPGGLTCTSTAQVVYPYVPWTQSINGFPEGVVYTMVADGNPISCVEGSKCTDTRHVVMDVGDIDINHELTFQLGMSQRRNVGVPTSFEAKDHMYWRSDENNEPVGEPIVHIKTFTNPSPDPVANPNMRAQTAGITLGQLNYARLYVDLKYADGSIVQAQSFAGTALVLDNARHSHSLISEPIESTTGYENGQVTRPYVEVAFMPEDALLVGTDAQGDSYFDYQGRLSGFTAEVADIVMESSPSLLRRMSDAVVWAADAVSQMLFSRKLIKDQSQSWQATGVVNNTECTKVGCMHNGPAFDTSTPSVVPPQPTPQPTPEPEPVTDDSTPWWKNYGIEALVVVTIIAVGVVYTRRRSRATNTPSIPSNEEPPASEAEDSGEMTTVDLEGDDVDRIEAGEVEDTMEADDELEATGESMDVDAAGDVEDPVGEVDLVHCDPMLDAIELQRV